MRNSLIVLVVVLMLLGMVLVITLRQGLRGNSGQPLSCERMLPSDWDVKIRHRLGGTIPKTARTISQFQSLHREMSMTQIFQVVGLPDSDLGSGIHIYCYQLNDGSLVWVGTPDDEVLLYVDHVFSNGEKRRLVFPLTQN
jgi:hypothetical protein